MHLTHNLEIAGPKELQNIFIAGKEGIHFLSANLDGASKAIPLNIKDTRGAGEVRAGSLGAGKNFIATIEPMHGNTVVVYTDQGQSRKVVDSSINEGHAILTADFLGLGYDQIVVGWRQPGKNGKVGIKLYSKKSAAAKEWQQQWIDENTMACEDLQATDLNGDGRLDIVASGRGTHNLKIYWNISRAKR